MNEWLFVHKKIKNSSNKRIKFIQLIVVQHIDLVLKKYSNSICAFFGIIDSNMTAALQHIFIQSDPEELSKVKKVIFLNACFVPNATVGIR
ncbi:Arrestin-C [Trichinella spiralis]|uniref:Arrestin-C n=1 Tax=Trichinella spiralis TaxID=6334 RepID=A0ABR3KBD0_TRISP